MRSHTSTLLLSSRLHIQLFTSHQQVSLVTPHFEPFSHPSLYQTHSPHRPPTHPTAPHRADHQQTTPLPPPPPQACYGIQEIPDGSWLCRTCSINIRPTCLLCSQTGGAMKCTRAGDKWAHISCALWIPEVSIGCPEKMEPITDLDLILVGCCVFDGYFFLLFGNFYFCMYLYLFFICIFFIAFVYLRFNYCLHRSFCLHIISISIITITA